MHRKKSRFRVTAIGLTSLLTLFLASFPELVLAREANTLQEPNTPRQGLPGRRIGGGTRGDCNFGEKTLTALIPQKNLGLTVAANPTLLFFVPQTSGSQVVEFVLNDETDDLVYETTFNTTGTSGVISLSVPDSTPLKIGKKYHWYVSIICDPQDRAQDISVDGWIQRVEANPTLASKLEKVAPLERAALYAASDIWYEALTTLAKLRQSRPNDPTIAAEWAKLLQSVGLDNIAQEPLATSQKR